MEDCYSMSPGLVLFVVLYSGTVPLYVTWYSSVLGLVPSTCSKAVVLSTRRHTLHTPVVCPEVIVAAVQYNQKYNHEVRANIYIKNSTIYNMQTLYTIYIIRCLAVPGFLFINTQDQML